MGGIFISYRRSETALEAISLYRRLAQHFGADQVFMDSRVIRPGDSLPETIQEHLDSCDALIALIGKGWADSRDRYGRRRLEDPNDFVRTEIATALKREILVIPVLVQDAVIPLAEDLPGELAALVRRLAIEVSAISDPHWDWDVERLIDSLTPAVRVKPPGRPPEPELQDLRVLLPNPVASFTGRSEELRWLAEPRTGPVVVAQALAGLGGVGKTALALEHAHRCFYTDHSVDLAWWFVAADRLSLCASMAQLYEQITGIPAGEDSVLAAGRLRNWLESSPHRWLVVFDNADTAGVLDGLVPRAGSGQVLITSRRTDWSPLGATVRRLDVLPPDDSVALLHAISGCRDEEGARLLSRELGGLAVALHQAGRLMSKAGWDYDRYLQMLRARPLSLHREDLAGAGTTVAKVWESSLEHVTGDGGHGTLAADVLGVLAYYGAEDIPRFLLEAALIDGEALLWGGDALAVELALVRLADYSLVNLEPDAIGLHRLVQHLSRAHIEDQVTGADHIAAAIRLLLGALTAAHRADVTRVRIESAGPGPPTEVVSRLLPHITEATAHAVRLSVVPHETTSLLNVVVRDRLGIGQLDVARALLDRALGLAIAHLGPDHPETLRTRNHLASWQALAGKVGEAVAQSQALLEDCVRVLGPDHLETLRTQNNLAFYLGALGSADQAVARSQDLLEAHRDTVGPNHPETLTARNVLSFWLAQTGRVGEAVSQLQAALEDCMRILGPDHPDTLRTRLLLAFCLGQTGRVDRAVAESEALLEDCVRVLGPDHPETLTARNVQAVWLGATGRVGEAFVQSQDLLDDCRRVLGPDHPETLRARSNVALWGAVAGKAQEAISQFQALLEDCRRVLGPDHPETLSTHRVLAFWLAHVGRIAEGISELQALLDDCLRVLGPDHPHTLTTRNHLAYCIGEAGDVHEAIAQGQAVLEDRLRVLGPDHPDTLTTRDQLAHWIGETGNVHEAISQTRAVLEDRLRILGPDHPDTLWTRGALARWIGEAGDEDGAVSRLQTLLEDRLRVLGPDHPDTSRTRTDLTRWLSEVVAMDEPNVTVRTRPNGLGPGS
jgi:tetratricopeptide (TPR) repeat protein